MTTTRPPLAPREQRVLDALRALAPPDSRRVVVSINDLAVRLGMLPGEASRAVIKLWLLRRIRGYQEPRGADPSEFEIVEAAPKPDTTEQPVVLSESANTNTTPKSESAPATDVEPRGHTEGGRGEAPNDSSDSIRNVRTNDSNETISINILNGSIRNDSHDSNRNDPTRAREEELVHIGTVIAERATHLGLDASAPLSDTTNISQANTSGLAQDEAATEVAADSASSSTAEPPRLVLARECAEKLGDAKNLTVYLVLASRYPEQRLRKALAVVLAVPAEDIRRSRGALFTHVVQQGT